MIRYILTVLVMGTLMQLGNGGLHSLFTPYYTGSLLLWAALLYFPYRWWRGTQR